MENLSILQDFLLTGVADQQFSVSLFPPLHTRSELNRTCGLVSQRLWLASLTLLLASQILLLVSETLRPCDVPVRLCDVTIGY